MDRNFFRADCFRYHGCRFMVAQQTRASASIVLPEQSQNIPVAPPERFIVRDQLLVNCYVTHFSQTTPFLRSHLNVVETTIPGDEGCDLLAVLDQLYTDTLADGRVRLLSLNTAVNKRNALMSHQDLSAGFFVLFDP